MTQSPDPKLHLTLLVWPDPILYLLGKADPTLTSCMVVPALKQNAHVGYDIDCLPEMEGKGQTSLWARPSSLLHRLHETNKSQPFIQMNKLPPPPKGLRWADC